MKPTPASDPTARLPDTHKPLGRRELKLFVQLHTGNFLTQLSELPGLADLEELTGGALGGGLKEQLLALAAKLYESHPPQAGPAHIVKYIKSLRPAPPARYVDL